MTLPCSEISFYIKDSKKSVFKTEGNKSNILADPDLMFWNLELWIDTDLDIMFGFRIFVDSDPDLKLLIQTMMPDFYILAKS